MTPSSERSTKQSDIESNGLPDLKIASSHLQTSHLNRSSCPNAAESYLCIESVSKSFGDFVAIDQISLEVKEGELVCFLGPSGCGKTTLLRVIAGLEQQSQGTIIQRGRDISKLHPADRDFGIVFQNYALFPNLNVFRNVAYGLESRRARRGQLIERVAELLELVGLPDSGEKYPTQLSGGQQPRVALARALATSPGLLLLDEPLSALDAQVRVNLQGELKELQRKLKITTIMVTHDQQEALSMADRVVIMNNGVVEQIGPPMEVYRSPASPFVASFIGKMNFLEGVVLGPKKVRVGNSELDIDIERFGHAPGRSVSICFRPEDVTIRGTIPSEANSFIGSVIRMEFLGALIRCTIEVAQMGDVQLTADFSANAVHDLNVVEGMKMNVSLPAERLRVFPTGADL